MMARDQKQRSTRLLAAIATVAFAVSIAAAASAQSLVRSSVSGRAAAPGEVTYGPGGELVSPDAADATPRWVEYVAGDDGFINVVALEAYEFCTDCSALAASALVRAHSDIVAALAGTGRFEGPDDSARQILSPDDLADALVGTGCETTPPEVAGVGAVVIRALDAGLPCDELLVHQSDLSVAAFDAMDVGAVSAAETALVSSDWTVLALSAGVIARHVAYFSGGASVGEHDGYCNFDLAGLENADARHYDWFMAHMFRRCRPQGNVGGEGQWVYEPIEGLVVRGGTGRRRFEQPTNASGFYNGGTRPRLIVLRRPSAVESAVADAFRRARTPARAVSATKPRG